MTADNETAQPAVEMQDVWFSYGQRAVLREVSLRVAEGEFACVIGPNGGGKTTLLKLMLGLLAPTRGTVRIFGRPCEQARALMGYVPQNPSFDRGFPASAMDVVLMGRVGTAGLGPYRKADRIAAGEAIAEVGLYEQRRRPFTSLSGGQQQRILIARALASYPKLLLLDEPTAGLDIRVEAEFYELLSSLSDRLAIVLVSHDVGIVLNVAGKVICVRNKAAVHPTAGLTGEHVRELYGQDIRLVRHDHDCLRDHPEGGRR